MLTEVRPATLLSALASLLLSQACGGRPAATATMETTDGDAGTSRGPGGTGTGVLASSSGGVDNDATGPSNTSGATEETTGSTADEPSDESGGQPGFRWSNVLVGPPPEMNDPLIVRGLDGLEEFAQNYTPANDMYPPGVLYWTGSAPTVPADTDIIFDLRGETIREPVKVWNARHVWVVGGTFIPDPDQGGGVGELANADGNGGLLSNQNLYPRIAGGNLLQVACSGTLRVEGVWMDAAGMNIDAIVGNANPGQTVADARANKRFELVNSRITGYRGHLANYETYGDGLHADAFQMQSEDSSYQQMLIENLVMLSGQEGIVANCIGSEQPGEFHVRNFVAAIDTRFIDPDPTRRQYPLFLAANAAEFSFEEVYVAHPQGWSMGANWTNNLAFQHWYPPTLTYYSSPELASGVVLPAEGITMYGGTIVDDSLGTPPEGTDFAPEPYVGADYESPWTVP